MLENNRGSSQLVLLAGLLLASSLVLSSPHDHHIHTIALPIFVLLFSVLIFANRSILQAENFPRIVGVLALCSTLPRAATYTYTWVLNNTDEKSLKGEVVSCIKETVVLSTYACLILLMSRSLQTEQELGNGQNDVETARLVPPIGVSPNRILDTSSVPDNSDYMYNDFLCFRHLGPSSSYHGGSDSDISISSASNRVKSEVIQALTAANQPCMAHDEDTSTEVEFTRDRL